MMSGKTRKWIALGTAGLMVAAAVAGSAPTVSADTDDSLTLPVTAAAMAEYTVVCEPATPCETHAGKNVPSGQTDGKRLLVGRENADDPRSDDSFVLLSTIDLADIPTGVGIASATVTYQLTAGNPVDLEIRGVTSAWSGAPFAELPGLGAMTGIAHVVDGTLVADITDLVRAAAGAGVVDVALVPTNVSGFGQVFSPTARPASRRPVVEIEFITDDIAPSIALTAPTGGPHFGLMTVAADASDNVGVDRVELYVDGIPADVDTSAPWEFLVDLADFPDGPHFLTVRAVDGVGLSAEDGVGIAIRNEWSTMQRLDWDLTHNTISADEYATWAVDFVLGVSLPSRYGSGEQPHAMTTWFVGVLALWSELTPEVRDTLEYRLGGYDVDGDGVSAPATPFATTTEAAAADPAVCAQLSVEVPYTDFSFSADLWCRASYDRFTITYPPTSFADFDGSDDDGNGIPDSVDKMADTIATSRTFYVDELGYPTRGDMVVVVNPKGGSGLSLPGLPLVDAPIIIGAKSLEGYLPAHEVFHQYQYNFISVFDFSWSGGILGPFSSLGDEIDSVRWYMEVTAEWAAHKYLADAGWAKYNYANDIDEFLDDPWNELARVSWFGTSASQYGAFVFAEWLEDRGDIDLVQEVWEEISRGSGIFVSPHVYKATDRALSARGMGDFGDNIADLWVSIYDLDFDAVAAATDIDEWRKFLDTRKATKGEDPAVISSEPRMARVSDSREDVPAGDAAILMSAGDVAAVDVPLEDFAGSVVEIKPDEAGVLYIEMDLDNHVEVVIRPLTSYGGSLCSTPTTTRSGNTLESIVPFPSGCEYVAVIVANGDDDPHGGTSLTARFGEQADRTINNGTIRLGINDEGHLNVPGFDPSSGTGTSTVGLRYIPTNADSLSPGCECEGWGIYEKISEYSGWANNSWGGVENLDVVRADYGDDTATSAVWLDYGFNQATVSVEHDIRPVPGVPYLYAFDVEVTNITAVNSDTGGYYGPVHPIYRRVMDWDVEPTAFSEYVTIAAPGGVVPPEILFTSNDGFGSPNPADPRSDLGATGLFDDFGPADHGAMIEIDLGRMDPVWSPRVTFTMYYGAAPDEQTALDALAQVGAELYSLAQPDVVGGATTGEPNTFIWGYKGGEGGPIPPVFTATATTASSETGNASIPGVRRQ